jgi:His Kinase A (phospho-acceptor) domain
MMWSARTHGFEATAPAPFTGHWSEAGNPPDYRNIQYGVPAADRAPSFHDHRPLVGEAQVLRTVAHELRSPLTALVTAAELLAHDFDELESDQKREIISSMHRGALWMHTLVENLLCDASIREGDSISTGRSPPWPTSSPRSSRSSSPS